MTIHSVLSPLRALALGSLLLLGCDSADPFTSGQGHASVLISVSDTTGLPLPGVSVRIACGNGGPSTILQTDSTGRVGANLIVLPNLPGYSGYLGLQLRFALD